VRIAILISYIFAMLVAVTMPASSETRVALVIGNSSYQNVPFLPNPTNDATDISASLTRLGFSVRTLTNAKYDDMRRGLLEFGRQARGSDMAVVFFAGHGIQLAGENWLIPVDAQLATDMDVANEAIGLQAVTRAVSNTTKLGLVILDACRSNPFLPKMQSTNVQRSVERGFSRVEPSENVLVAYAAREGTTAADGSGRNSPFTRSLLNNLESPGLEISYLFRIVRDDVLQATRREQQPFLYGSLSKEMIYLKSPPVDAVLAAANAKPQPNIRDAGRAVGAEAATVDSRVSLGLNVIAIDPDVRAQYSIRSAVKGLLIKEVASSSDSAAKRILEGDVIVEVAQQAVSKPDDFKRRVDELKRDGKRSVLLLISNKEGERRFVAVSLD
jgi:Caspase domain